MSDELLKAILAGPKWVHKDKDGCFFHHFKAWESHS